MVLDDKKFVKTGADLLPEDLTGARWPLPRRPYLLETSIPGVFCVGDARSNSVKRVASAVGEGVDLRAARSPRAARALTLKARRGGPPTRLRAATQRLPSR